MMSSPNLVQLGRLKLVSLETQKMSREIFLNHYNAVMRIGPKTASAFGNKDARPQVKLFV